jgi:LysM repeat protein
LRRIFCRFSGLALLAFSLAGCGFGLSPDSLGVVSSVERRELPGHVYLLRGLIGEVFSLGLYDLAAKIEKRGVKASVHGMVSAGSLADEIITNYRSDPSLAPIVLIGHSTGGDLIISMAERLKTANVPVALAIGFDPTPIAGDVPSNVELFINLYQATNIIGGGRATPGKGFRGRLINVDLRDRREIVHITLDKSPIIHGLLTEKIIGIAELAAEQRKVAAAAPSKKTQTRRETSGSEVRPLVMKYVVPAKERIELWDSAVSVIAGDGDTLESIASRTGAPAWALAQINTLGENETMQPGRKLLVPRSIYAPGHATSDGKPDTAIGAARVRASSSIR